MHQELRKSSPISQNNLSRKFKVSGIPTLVLLEADTGKTITTDGRSIVVEDPEGVNFPWKPKPLAELIGDKFIHNNMKEVGVEAIEGKVLGLYFSAHWVSVFTIPASTDLGIECMTHNQLTTHFSNILQHAEKDM